MPGDKVRAMADVTLLHNRQCSTSRHALDVVKDNDVDVDVVEYLKTPLDAEQLADVVEKLEDPVADLVRKDSYFKDQGLDAADYTTPDTVIPLLVEHPRLMQRPILVKGGRAIIGRPKDRVEPFVTGG
jgi:arsenate reductase (glutaredoxin)